MHVRFSPTAESDLDGIHNYIAEHNPAAALRIIDTLILAADQLGAFPFLGRPGRIDGTRELTVPRTPYILIYTLPDAYHVDVETIVHTRRQWPPEPNA